MSLDQLVSEYQKLSPAEQSRFQNRLGLFDYQDELTESQWAELKRRDVSFEVGKMPTFSHEEIMADLDGKYDFPS